MRQRVRKLVCALGTFGAPGPTARALHGVRTVVSVIASIASYESEHCGQLGRYSLAVH